MEQKFTIKETETGRLTGAGLIVEERRRQVVSEGYTEAHDRGHDWRELLLAAEAYLLWHTHDEVSAVVTWPWGAEYYKPKDALRDLTRAGALVAAAIDRLQAVAVEEEGGGE